MQYAKSKGFTFIKGNPGAKVDSAYVNIFDNIAIYERFGAPCGSRDAPQPKLYPIVAEILAGSGAALLRQLWARKNSEV